MKRVGESENRLQRTLAERVTITGTGLHSGERSVVVLHPAEEDTGIVFSSNGRRLAGLATHVVDTSRGTTLGCGELRFRTIEHLMAAISGLGIDNVLVEVEGPELPALDGSSMPYVEAISAAGTVELSKRLNLLKLREPIWVKRGDSFILAVPSDSLRITYVLSYNHPLIGSQTASFDMIEGTFEKEIAAARTFVMYEEIAGLVSQDLAKGGSLSNAIVVWQDKLSSELRFDNELARHKVLDLIGDSALAGGRLAADIVAVKSGHTLNVEFARAVIEHIASGESREAA